MNAELRGAFFRPDFCGCRCNDDCRTGDFAARHAGCVTTAMMIGCKHRSDAEIYVWNDMVDSECQKGGEWSQGLCLPITGVRDLLPKDIGIGCWTSNRESSIRFATACGHKTFIAGYYGRKTMDAARDEKKKGK